MLLRQPSSKNSSGNPHSDGCPLAVTTPKVANHVSDREVPACPGWYHITRTRIGTALRNVTGARIAGTLDKNPKIYSDARRCMAVLPRVKERVQVALGTLGRLNPESRFPPVTDAVGRGKACHWVGHRIAKSYQLEGTVASSLATTDPLGECEGPDFFWVICVPGWPSTIRSTARPTDCEISSRQPSFALKH